MSDWDASRYHRISGPQFDWGQRVLARLQPAPGERILDLGCGTGRLTQEILAATPDGCVVGLDRSDAMIAVARESIDPHARRRPAYVHGDGARIAVCRRLRRSVQRRHAPLDSRSPAGVRQRLRRAPSGGRFVAQCGGEGNLARLLDRTAALMSSSGTRRTFRDWQASWYFADPDSTSRRLRAAGFVNIDTWLEEAPVDLSTDATYGEFISCVCIRHHLARLPLQLREPFVHELTAMAAETVRLSCWTTGA
jgi:trans-aconitate 2-methyltransferase